MSRPLESSYNWRTPVSISSIGLVICVIVLSRSKTNGWFGVAIVLVLLWAGFMALVWARTRAMIEVYGYQLRVRRFRDVNELDGRRVASVREYLTASGPSYRVRMIGDEKTYFVPTALLRKGHSTFFDWLLTYSPDVELDKGSRKTIDQLRTRGLIE
jgi:hypothetical protein